MRQRSAHGSFRPDGGSKPRTRRDRRMASTDIDITPMIDVTFLLLVFFMVTSTMQGKPDQNVPAARNGIGLSTADSLIVRITLPDGAAEPVVDIESTGDEGISLEELPAIVGGRRNEFANVVLKADRNVPEGQVQRVARALGDVEGLRFYVGVRETTR